MLYILGFNSACVYFNTFYNAEVSFYKAEKYIEEESSFSSEIPSQAKKLLDKTINNCLIVIDKYPDSKWVDDAIYLLARSKFLKGELISAKEKFNQLITKFPQSKYVKEAGLWILFCNVQLLNLEDFSQKINSEKTKNHSSSNRYLLNKINAEYFNKINILDSCYYYYLNALNFTDNQSQKISVYSKLALISSENKDYEKSINFIDILEDFSKGNEKIELSLKKIEYYKNLNKYDQIILEIPMMLDSEEYKSKKLYLELELAKAYMNKGDFSQAKEYFIEITENNQKKDETAESYYWLGMMSIQQNFDLILADDYFEKSKLDKSSSRYGRESKDLLRLLSKYDKLVELYNNSIQQNNDLDTLNLESSIELKLSSYNSSDSLYMMMIDMINFDFGRRDKAIEEYKKFVKKYKESRYIPQVYFILSKNDSLKWQLLIDEEYPESKFSSFSIKQQNNEKLDSINEAWELISLNKEQSFKKFVEIGNTFRDTSSYYMAAFIADKYMNNLDSALVYYKMFINRFPSHSYSTASKFRLNEIRDFLIEETEFIDKLLIYNEAIYLLTEANDLDTSKALFATLSNRGNESKYNFSISAKQIKDKINYYQSLTESIYNDDSLDVESQSSSYKDSLYYYASYSFETLLNNPDSADYYYNYVIKNFNSSKFFNKSMLGLYRIHKNKELLNRINTESYIDWDDTIVDKSFLIDNYVLDEIELVQKKKYLTKIQKYIDLIPSDSSLFSHEENKENNQLKSKSNQIPNIQDMKNMSNFKFDLNDPK